MENSTSIAYKKENTTFKNELTSNQILDFASMLQLVLGCSIIMLNLFSTLILIRSAKMMFSVRLPAINMSISYILLGIGLLVPDTLVFDRHVCLSKNYTVQALLFVSSLIITMMNADRVFSLRFPFKYSSLMSRKNVRIGCLMCWLIGFFSCIHENTCGWTNLVTQRPLTYNFGFFSAIIVFNILGYCYVIHYAISATRGKINMKCIKKVSLYTGCFVLFAFPYIISRFAHTMSPKPNRLLINLKELFARLIFVTPFLNPILYTILFTECRFQLLTFICFWNTKLLNKYKEKAKKNKCTYTIESISKSVNFR